jgi:hypothetical protein
MSVVLPDLTVSIFKAAQAGFVCVSLQNMKSLKAIAARMLFTFLAKYNSP